MKRKARQFLVLLGGILLLAGIVAVVLYGIQTSRFGHWLAQDAETMAPYSTVLFREGASTSIPEPKLDAILVEEVTHGRLVVELSRSEYRRDLLGRHAWAKVHLVTSKPGDESIHIRIKLLVELVLGREGWRVEDVRELALP